jgi:hypothetical protein
MEKIVAFRYMGDISSEGTYNSGYPCCSWGSYPNSLIFYNLCNQLNQADFLICSTCLKEGGLIA